VRIFIKIVIVINIYIYRDNSSYNISLKLL
jgi:hypothetical protein